MLLSLDEKGFDGQYNYLDSTHALNKFPQLSKCHIIEIEELLRDSTNNNPDDRPTIDDFIDRLNLWKSVISDYNKQQKSQWTFLYKHILNNSGESVIWRNNGEIIDILNKISALNAYNHMFYPDGGGQDFRYAKRSPENDGIEIWVDDKSCNIVFPKALHFEAFPGHNEWNYFILELNNVDKLFKSKLYYEVLVEDTPAHYVEPTYFQYGGYDYDKGNKYPDGYRLVSRYTGGKILFVLKNGPYNHINSTYDARHNLCSCEDFRDYISSLIKKSYDYGNDQNSFYNSKFANFNPFYKDHGFEEKHTANYSELIDNLYVRSDIYLSTKFHFPYSKEDFNDNNSKYYISFTPNDGTFSLDFKEIRLCKDGYLHNLEQNEFENVMFFESRDIAHKIKEYCKQQLFSSIKEFSLSFFTVNIIGISKPSHLFTKDEIEKVMREADDRKNNTLVIDENGYPQIISNKELDVNSFPVYHEQWNAGNLYVGKYSDLSTLNEDYLSSLQGWLSYLQHHRSVCVDYIDDIKDINKLITAIDKL